MFFDWWGVGIFVWVKQGWLWFGQCHYHPITSSFLFFIKIQNSLTFLVPAYLGSPGLQDVKPVSFLFLYMLLFLFVLFLFLFHCCLSSDCLKLSADSTCAVQVRSLCLLWSGTSTWWVRSGWTTLWRLDTVSRRPAIMWKVHALESQLLLRLMKAVCSTV